MSWEHKKKNHPNVPLPLRRCDDGPAPWDHDAHEFFQAVESHVLVTGNQVQRIQTIAWYWCPGRLPPTPLREVAAAAPSLVPPVDTCELCDANRERLGQPSAIGRNCDICAGLGVDYLGRRCRHGCAPVKP